MDVFRKERVAHFVRCDLLVEQMFCFQCEQTRLRKGCTTVGVCGKTPQVAELQDLLIHVVKGISLYGNAAAKMGCKISEEIYDFTFSAMFRLISVVQLAVFEVGFCPVLIAHILLLYLLASEICTHLS